MRSDLHYGEERTSVQGLTPEIGEELLRSLVPEK